jgi:hypothetical protein
MYKDIAWLRTLPVDIKQAFIRYLPECYSLYKHACFAPAATTLFLPEKDTLLVIGNDDVVKEALAYWAKVTDSSLEVNSCTNVDEAVESKEPKLLIKSGISFGDIIAESFGVRPNVINKALFGGPVALSAMLTGALVYGFLAKNLAKVINKILYGTTEGKFVDFSKLTGGMFGALPGLLMYLAKMHELKKTEPWSSGLDRGLKALVQPIKETVDISPPNKDIDVFWKTSSWLSASKKAAQSLFPATGNINVDKVRETLNDLDDDRSTFINSNILSSVLVSARDIFKYAGIINKDENGLPCHLLATCIVGQGWPVKEANKVAALIYQNSLSNNKDMWRIMLPYYTSRVLPVWLANSET